MSTVSSSTSSINPYAVAYSTSNIMNDTVAASLSPSSTSSSSGTGSSSGTYSQGLVSQMSGLDVNSMTNQMMTSDLIQLNKLLANEQNTQWTQDRYRSVITNLNNFSGNYFDILSSNNVLLSSKYSVNSVTATGVADASLGGGSTLVNATADSTALQGTYNVSWTQLAKAAQLVNGPALNNGSSVTNSSTLATLSSSLTSGLPTSGTISFKINGNTVSYDLGANQNKTVGQVMSDLSNLSGSAGATFSYSELTGKFAMTDKTTGASNYITLDTTNSDSTIQSNTQSFFNNIFGTGFTGAATTQYVGKSGDANNVAASTSGQDAKFTITEPNGAATPVTESSNKFIIDGVSYDFSNSASIGSATITVSPDVSSVVSKVQNFVNDYNNLIGGIQDLLNEKKDYNYPPLTAAQQSKMTSDQITQWNQKAQQGLLSNDSTLNNMLISMREAFYTPVSGVGLTMSDIGLSTSNDPTQGGKLTLDTNKLTAALKNNPQQVINMLTQTSTNVPSYNPDLTNDQIVQRSNEEGIFQRLNDITQEYVGTQIDKYGNQGILLMKAGVQGGLSETKNTLFKQLLSENNDITDYKTKIKNDQKRYTTQFTTLQTLLSQMSSQQNYLSSMLSSASSG